MQTEPLQLNNMARDSGKKKLLVPIDNMGRECLKNGKQLVIYTLSLFILNTKD